MNYVYCSDLKNYQVIGTFLESLYYLQLDNKNPVPLVIVGSRDAHKLPALKEFLLKNLNISEGIYKINSEQNLVEDEKTATIISTEEELKNITYSGINIGIGTLSSIISKHRCTCLCLEKWQDEINTYIHHAKIFLESFKRAVNQHVNQEDTIYIYNGRHYNTYPQTLFCEQNGYNIIYYERMNSWKNLRFQKTRIHDFNATSDIVKFFWDTSKDPLKTQLAEQFYEKNIRNKFSEDFSSSKELFDRIGDNKEIISYFASSEDEYAALDPRISLSDIFDSQRDAINYLINWVASQEKYLLVIRLHPNQNNICKKDYKFWHSISGKNVTLIPSHSSLSSYELAKKSSIVLSYLSTIGIEATRMCIPSITLGNPMYKGLNAVFEPKSKEQLLQLLQTKLLPKAAANTLPYGYYNLCYGPSLKLMEALGLNEFSEYSEILN